MGVRGFLKGLHAGRRPPTGPLTTSEAVDAEALRQKTALSDEGQQDEDRQTETSPESDVAPA
jgi:hypothetical protein